MAELCGPKKEKMGKFDKWEVEDAARDIQRSEEHKNNPELMKQVKKVLKNKVNSLKDLKKVLEEKYGPEMDDEEDEKDEA